MLKATSFRMRKNLVAKYVSLTRKLNKTNCGLNNTRFATFESFLVDKRGESHQLVRFKFCLSLCRSLPKDIADRRHQEQLAWLPAVPRHHHRIEWNAISERRAPIDVACRRGLVSSVRRGNAVSQLIAECVYIFTRINSWSAPLLEKELLSFIES